MKIIAIIFIFLSACLCAANECPLVFSKKSISFEEALRIVEKADDLVPEEQEIINRHKSLLSPAPKGKDLSFEEALRIVEGAEDLVPEERDLISKNKRSSSPSLNEMSLEEAFKIIEEMPFPELDPSEPKATSRKESLDTIRQKEINRLVDGSERRKALSNWERFKLLTKEKWEHVKDRFRGAYVSNYRWLNDYIPDDFVDFLPIDFVKNNPRGTLIEVIKLESRMSQTDRKRGYAKSEGQLLTPHTVYEKILLNTSQSYRGRPEVLQLRAFDSNGKVIGASPIVVGNSSRSLSHADFSYALQNFNWKGTPILVEIAHTHPFYEYARYTVAATTNAHTQHLGYQDKESLYQQSFRWKIPIRFKAVVPNGYSYSLTMKSGKYISDPLIER